MYLEHLKNEWFWFLVALSYVMLFFFCLLFPFLQVFSVFYLSVCVLLRLVTLICFWKRSAIKRIEF